MYTTTFKFEEGSPYLSGRRPVGAEIHERLMCQVRRLCKDNAYKPGWELIVYTPIPAYLDKPTTLEVYWDFDNPSEYGHEPEQDA
ncbi:hypothetical protein [Pontibacter roseus]|uniref:hypothetical protein n=1 Tax=Pontibacter roseus TaxID=336989 RepID=UPI0003710776|nr:hypothetical protein [Pontibacter roseus]